MRRWGGGSGSASLGISDAPRPGEDGPTLADFRGAPQDAQEQSMVFERTARKPAVLAAMHSHRA